MGEIDLRRIAGNQLVIHYGGQLASVDAYTFANSLVSLADTIRAINRQINPSLSIEVRLEAIGPGSFRAVIKSLQKGLKGLLHRQGENVVVGVLMAVVLQYWFKDDIKIVVNDDSYVIERDGDRIILPRAVYDQVKNVQTNRDVQQGVKRTFEILSNDPAVENFGFTESITDTAPLIQIPKADFSAIASENLDLIDPSKQRFRKERARLLVNRLWLRDVDRKWSFEWNGLPISASVKDFGFRGRIKDRQVSILSGDALDVDIAFVQTLDEKLGIYVNDHHTYAIERVYGKIDQSTGQEELF